MRFVKMQGIGNDLICIDCINQEVSDFSSLSILMCRHHFGVGADGVAFLQESTSADYSLRTFNSDGSETEMDGNALRCIGKLVYDKKLIDKKNLWIETRGGLKEVRLIIENNIVTGATVDMGSPELNPAKIPVDLPGEIVLRHRMQIMGQTYFITCVSMGNPHAVIFVRDPEVIDLPVIGPLLEHHPLFPRRTNIEFVRVISRDVLQMRVWERGAGETLACGTGACAALVASVLNSQSNRHVQMKLAGGNLQINWNPEDNHVYQTGPAVIVFEGEWPTI